MIIRDNSIELQIKEVNFIINKQINKLSKL